MRVSACLLTHYKLFLGGFKNVCDSCCKYGNSYITVFCGEHEATRDSSLLPLCKGVLHFSGMLRGIDSYLRFWNNLSAPSKWSKQARSVCKYLSTMPSIPEERRCRHEATLLSLYYGKDKGLPFIGWRLYHLHHLLF